MILYHLNAHQSLYSRLKNSCILGKGSYNFCGIDGLASVKAIQHKLIISIFFLCVCLCMYYS